MGDVASPNSADASAEPWPRQPIPSALSDQAPGPGLSEVAGPAPIAATATAQVPQPASARPAWQETFEGNSAAAERLVFEQLAREIMAVQAKTKRRSRDSAVQRAFHAKAILGVVEAELRFRDDLPATLAAGFARPGAAYPTTVRFSNAHGSAQGDDKADMRGVALRVVASPDEHHDLLMTNFPVSHARNARQFVAFAKATAGNTRDRLLGLAGLAWRIGPGETLRMIRNVQAGRTRQVRSLALETYWSRGAIRWGQTLAVRYLLRPAVGADHGPEPAAGDPGYLRRDLGRRLRAGDVVFDLSIQPFVDEERTPIEDTAIEWTETVSRPVPVATLTIKRRDIDEAGARAQERLVDELAFNPWHTTDEFRPLGNLNRARRAVYEASGAHRLGHRFHASTPFHNRTLSAAARASFRHVNRFVEWHKLPLQLGLLNLNGYRHVLRQQNLIDTEVRGEAPAPLPVPASISEDKLAARTYDGSYNDLGDPKMGAIGSAFGRNLKPVYRPERFDTPSPVLVSRELLTRETFIPARSLNILAAAWIQFQVHDWVSHARYKPGEQDVVVPLPPGQTWQNRPGGPAEPVMRFADDKGLDPGQPGAPPILFGNMASHWWDGSEVYGPDEAKARSLREGTSAKIRLVDGHLPEDCSGMQVTGFNESWWLGLSAFHTLFAREHNVICDALRREYPYLGDERIYQTARLIVSALIAKIHTVEWTPAILATPAIEIALRTNWEGPPNNWLTRLGLALLDAHSLQGIPKTLPDHHSAPYSLTEDFVTVYRMHPLLPDDYELRDHQNGRVLQTKGFLDIQGAQTDEVMRSTGLDNALYSFGIAYPGAITLHNYPNSLRALERGGERVDLAVVDLVRTRRRGVPRYNDFRAGLHKSRVRRFEDLTADPESVRRLKDIYRDIDLVDTMVGLFAETPPFGFGFSDTAFRIFILMASRRLQSDRFLTVDFRPEIYTPLGMDWIARNGMHSVILRHCPDLAAVMPRTASAFAPWRPIATPREAALAGLA